MELLWFLVIYPYSTVPNLHFILPHTSIPHYIHIENQGKKLYPRNPVSALQLAPRPLRDSAKSSNPLPDHRRPGVPNSL